MGWKILRHQQSPCDSVVFPEASLSDPRVGKSPEAREKPSFLVDSTPCMYN